MKCSKFLNNDDLCLNIIGILIRRYRIFKFVFNDDEYYIVEDFNIGCEINFYFKVFKFINVDDFIKNFFRKMGVRVNDIENKLENLYIKYRKVVS